MKIISVIGARPQFVKAAVVSHAIEKRQDIKEIIVHTGQHFDKNMSELFFMQMGIPQPNYNLGIHSMSHGAMTGQMIEALEKIYLEEMPDEVLVYGDTNSTLAASIAASKLNIPIAHIEAGLRSYKRTMPEEINRLLTDAISAKLFCPCKAAIDNLKLEGISKNVILSGDVMYDAALFYSKKEQAPNFELPQKFALCTIHRAENTDNKDYLLSILEALESISKDCKIVLPLHPRTKKYLGNYGFDFSSSSILFVQPIGYLETLYLLKRCVAVITDSGGLQKEAFFFNKYCVNLREETEWTELVDFGYNFLCSHDKEKIIETFYSIEKKADIAQSEHQYIYGKGNAAEIIVENL